MGQDRRKYTIPNDFRDIASERLVFGSMRNEDFIRAISRQHGKILQRRSECVLGFDVHLV